MKKYWWLILFPLLALIGSLLVVWTPVPSFLTDRIPALIESRLPPGWRIEQWQFKKQLSLLKLVSGSLPHIVLELTNDKVRIPVEVDAHWNESYGEPEIQINFRTRLISETLTTSEVSGRGYLQLTKNFMGFNSWTLEIPKHEKIELEPYGSIENFAVIVVEPLHQELNGNLELGKANFNLNLNNETYQVKLGEIRSGFVIDRNHSVVTQLVDKVSVTAGRAEIKSSQFQYQAKDASVYFAPAETKGPDGFVKKVFELSVAKGDGQMTISEQPWESEIQQLEFASQVLNKDLEFQIGQALGQIQAVVFRQGETKDLTFEKIKFSGQGDLSTAQAQLGIGSGAFLIDELILVLPERGLNFKAEKNNNDHQLLINGALKTPVRFSATCEKGCQLSWNIGSELAYDFATYQEMNPEGEEWPMSFGGQWSTRGRLQLSENFAPLWPTFSNTFSLKSAWLRFQDIFQVKDVALKWPQIGRGSVKGFFKLGDLQYKNFKGGLQVQPWQWTYNLAKGEFGFSFLKADMSGDLKPVVIANQDFKFKKADDFRYNGTLQTSIADLSPYLEKMCVGRKEKSPQISLNLSYPEIKVTQDSIIPRGSTKVELFQGKAELTNFKVFKWLTSVPETQFDFDSKGFQLEALGAWLNFGRMQGSLHAFSKGVVFQSRLPTQFRTEIALDPLPGKREVIFSSRAMQNFTQLFTPQDFAKQLPGLLRWFTFGWPSDLIGGFNIQYAGVSMFAREGSILLQTLDPPEIVAKEKEHFLLYGRRFKIPINAWSYPVVLDHQGMTQFISHMYSYLVSLKAQEDDQSNSNGENNDSENWCKYKLDSPPSL